MLIFLLVSIIFLVVGLYNRYIPVRSVPCLDRKMPEGNDDILIVDIRDYQDSANDPIEGSMTIPTAYLKRNAESIPAKNLHVISTDSVGKNIGIRVLRKFGYKVVGYTVTECNCR